jgi:hypothetical protein
MNVYPAQSVYAKPLTAKAMLQYVRFELEKVGKRFMLDPRPASMSKALAGIDQLRIQSHLWWVAHEATGKPVALKPLETAARAIRRETLRAEKNAATGKMSRAHGFRVANPEFARQDMLRTIKQLEGFLSSRHEAGLLLAVWTDYAAGAMRNFGLHERRSGPACTRRSLGLKTSRRQTFSGPYSSRQPGRKVGWAGGIPGVRVLPFLIGALTALGPRSRGKRWHFESALCRTICVVLYRRSGWRALPAPSWLPSSSERQADRRACR